MSQIFAGNVADSVDTGTEVPEPMEQWADAIVSAGAGGQPTVATSASVMSDHNMIYLYTGSESGYIYGHIYYWNGSAWTDGGAYGGVSSSGTGLTDDIKQALLDCFEHVAWTDEHGQDYVDALEAALYPPANLVSISAVYTQSGTVYDTDTLDSLRDDLVVTAHYDNGTSETVTNYTLSGTLAVGTSTVTVSYGGKTATFSVTVTHYVQQYTITNNLTNVSNNNTAVSVVEETAYSGTLSVETGYIMSSVNVTMGNTDITSTAYNAETGAISIASVTGNVVITAEAVEDVGWISGVPYDYETIAGESFGNRGAYTRGDYTRTDILPMTGASYLMIESDKDVTGYFYIYDSGTDSYTSNKTQNFSVDNTIKYPIGYDGKNRFGVTAQTNRFPTSLTMTPYKVPDLGENTVWESGKEYNLLYPENVRTGNYSAGAYYTTDYFNCLAASTITFGPLPDTDSNGTVKFYDSSKTQIGTTESIGYIALGTTKDVTVPAGAYYFTVTAKFRQINQTFVTMV